MRATRTTSEDTIRLPLPRRGRADPREPGRGLVTAAAVSMVISFTITLVLLF